MKKISVVLPCLNEAQNIPDLIPEIIKNISGKYDYEIICVNDGSTDETTDVLQAFCENNKKIKAIILYSRSGHQAALKVGIEHSTGDAVITMDADFQHPPELISELIERWEAGHDLVSAQKSEDKASDKRTLIARKFGYFMWNKFSGGVLVPGVSEFRLISRKIAEYIIKNPESELFLRGLVKLVAKNPTNVKYKVGQRKYGKSAYTLRMSTNVFLNGFISFSTWPLRSAWIFGSIVFVVLGFYLLVDIISAVLLGNPILRGWLTVVLLSLILNGMILMYLGLMGEYLRVIFKETKKRPMYIVEKKINL